MGSAIIRAICKVYSPEKIYVSDPDHEKLVALSKEINCKIAENNEEAVLFGDYIFFCVKPQMMQNTLLELSEILEKPDNKILISIAAGLTIDTIKSYIPNKSIPVVRIMPNTAVSIGKAMLAMSISDEDININISNSEIDNIKFLLSQAGKLDVISEKLMDTFTAIGGSAPAFVYMFIDAMADAGVITGLSKDKAILYAAQTVMGASSMVLESNIHPAQLKDQVCSPAGSTIAGVRELEKGSFKSNVIESILACYNKNIELGNN